MLPWDATGNQLRKTISKCNSQISELKRERDALAARISELEERYEATRELSIARGRNLLESRREVRKLRDRISELKIDGENDRGSSTDSSHAVDEIKITVEDCKWAEERAREEAHDAASCEGRRYAWVDAKDRAGRFKAHAKYLESKSV